MSLPLCPQPPRTQPGLQWPWSLPNTLQQRGEGKRSFEGRKPEISVSDGRRKLTLQGRRKRECNKGVRTSAELWSSEHWDSGHVACCGSMEMDGLQQACQVHHRVCSAGPTSPGFTFFCFHLERNPLSAVWMVMGWREASDR